MIDITKFISLSREERQAHLDLTENCCERGGNSTIHKGILAQYLNTTIPSGRILLCHACNNAKCSNPKHLYWGTDKDNIVIDGKKFNTFKNIWERLVDKHGYEEACKLQSRRALNGIAAKAGAGNKGRPKSEEHKKKISEGLKALNSARVVERNTQMT
jgi:hypothetical protein